MDSLPPSAIGICPLCEEGVVKNGERSYYCENSVGAHKSCEFRLSKEIRSCLITESSARQLVSEGKTDLIEGFYSKWGNPFSASLVLNGEKIDFVFPPPKKKKQKGPIIIYTAGTDTNRRRH
jgi:DNA topoisomerase-3